VLLQQSSIVQLLFCGSRLDHHKEHGAAQRELEQARGCFSIVRGSFAAVAVNKTEEPQE